MKYLEHYKITNSGYLGTVVSLQLLFAEEPTSVVVSVFDPANTEVVNDTAATNDSGSLSRFFSYNYQSETTRLSGTYRITIQATIGGYTYYDSFVFNLFDLELEDL